MLGEHEVTTAETKTKLVRALSSGALCRRQLSPLPCGKNLSLTNSLTMCAAIPSKNSDLENCHGTFCCTVSIFSPTV